ncbi:uncharacterized protein LOC117102992 [Anneissia japonica]|uniref:uncharacterized protein LOC117102992 n=1 Tax=Anneissia japonica TaxID=1529436 RepID=UPI001425A7FC|nr:uncharacterized protein LOC117102992 [Anneissia japonica]
MSTPLNAPPNDHVNTDAPNKTDTIKVKPVFMTVDEANTKGDPYIEPQEIYKALTKLFTCKVTGNIQHMKLRVDGQLTSCLNGDRVLYSDNINIPLPRFMSINNFKARIFHDGQVDDRLKCSKCLQSGHNAKTCNNKLICHACDLEGHRKDQCSTEKLLHDNSGEILIQEMWERVIEKRDADTNSNGSDSSDEETEEEDDEGYDKKENQTKERNEKKQGKITQFMKQTPTDTTKSKEQERMNSKDMEDLKEDANEISPGMPGSKRRRKSSKNEILDLTIFLPNPTVSITDDSVMSTFGGYTGGGDQTQEILLGRETDTGTGLQGDPVEWSDDDDDDDSDATAVRPGTMFPTDSTVWARDIRAFDALRINIAGNSKKEKVGAFYANASKHSKSQHIAFVILSENTEITPDRRSISASVGDNVTLSVTSIIRDISGFLWKLNNNSIPEGNGKDSLTINNVRPSDAGIYECYTGERNGKHAIMRLIVRGCPTRMYGSNCDLKCPVCYNGGICDDVTGFCVCPAGFQGEDCSAGCGNNNWGRTCSIVCSSSGNCKGVMFCPPDPSGCACQAGFSGVTCDNDAKMKTIIGNIQRYDEREVRNSYQERLEQYFKANSIAVEKQVSVLISSLGRRTYNFLKDLVNPEKLGDKGYTDLVQILNEHFSPKPIKMAGHFHFYKREQKHDEKIKEYCATLMKLTEQ